MLGLHFARIQVERVENSPSTLVAPSGLLASPVLPQNSLSTLVAPSLVCLGGLKCFCNLCLACREQTGTLGFEKKVATLMRLLAQACPTHRRGWGAVGARF